MTEETKTPAASAVDKVKLAAAIVLALAGVVGYYVLAASPSWLRWGSVVAGLVLGAVVVALSSYGHELWQFALEARVELRKVVWPTRDETFKTTAVVFVFVVVAGVFFWLLDLGLAAATRALSGQGG